MPTIPKVILLIETSREYGRGLLRGIAKYSRLHGPWSFYREPGGLEKTMPELKKWGANGIIMRDLKKTEEIITMGLPTIIAIHAKQRPGVSQIITNCAMIGEMAAEHLLDRGFRHFAYCGLKDKIYWSRDRGRSFCKRIAEAGFKTYVYKQSKSRVKRLWQNEQIIMANWLKSLPKPVGLMTCNDDRSQHVVEACKIAGLDVPDEVAIIGVDNDELVCDLSNPPLSSVALNTEKVGYEAAELLDKLMAAPAASSLRSKTAVASHIITVQPTHIATRQSTDILAIEDREVAEAVRFIRKHAKEAIGVSNVVNAITMSRRALEQRFRRVLGRSIFSEIRRVRTEQVTRMLVETDLSVSQIALELGYPGIDHIARYFRQETGMSLQAYRKRYGSK